MKKNIFLIMACALLLVGCSTTKHLTYSYITTDSAPVNNEDPNAQAQIAEAAVSVDQSLQQISAVQMATHPGAKAPPLMNPETLGMAQQTSLDWTGPLEPLLQKIAAASHYRLRVLGTRPAIPVIVEINAQDQPLADILRNATYQAENKADITVYPGTKIIELRYYPS